MITMKRLLSKYIWWATYEGSYWAQCVWRCKVAWKELYWIQLGSYWGSAINGRNNITDIFTGYKRSIEWIPQEWDMIFFNMFQPYGHVAIVVHADSLSIEVIEQNWSRWSGTGTWDDAIRLKTYSYDTVLWRYERPKWDNERDPLVIEAISKWYYNGQEWDWLTDRIVLSYMKAIQWEMWIDMCPHTVEEMKLYKNPPQPKNWIITYKVHNETTDMSPVLQNIIFNNMFTYIEQDLDNKIKFKRVTEEKKEAQINIRFAYPWDEKLPAPFKPSSLAYAIMPIREIRVNDSKDFSTDFLKNKLLNVLDHEARHILWVKHVEDENDIMYYAYQEKKIASPTSWPILRANYSIKMEQVST